MTIRKLILICVLVIAPALIGAQAQGGLDPATLVKPLGNTWPTYSGDYTGRRFSSLKQADRNTVKNLTLAWISKVTAGAPGGRGANFIEGGVGNGQFGAGGGVTIKGSILMVDDHLYVTSPDNVWMLDARDGHEIWHYYWRTRGSTHIANRGVGIWHNYLFFETPDDVLVSLDMRTGKVIEFIDPEIEALQETIARKLGYKLVDHRLELYCVPLDEDKT